MQEINPVVLMILDGFGLPEADSSLKNAIKEANTPHLDELFEKFPHSVIHTSGEEVGLPENQMGNSEVGHLNIGSGRIIHSDMMRITRSFETGEFIQNPHFTSLMQNLSTTKKKLHLMGLVSDGGVHSHIDHLKSMISLCQKNYPDVELCLHAFLDGRDTPPKSGEGYIRDITEFMREAGHGRLVSVIGRYYAMDRDKRWDRIQKAYELIVSGKGKNTDDPVDAIQKFYKQEITDEFMEPILADSSGLPGEGDGVIFFNFRADRARQLSRTLNDPHFSEFKRGENKQDGRMPDLNFVCLTEYDEKFDLPVLFSPFKIKNLLGEVVADHGLTQLRLAETEKYAHVTFFFNGGKEEPFKNEERLLIPSPKVATYDLQPEMSAFEVKDTLVKQLASKKYSLIIVNFANGDMVGHTGKFEAAVKAVETLDHCLGEIKEEVLSNDYQMLITADHGNCEQMLAEDHKTPFTQHTTAPVPLILVSQDAPEQPTLKNGKLADIAPTILKLMGLPIPEEMTGEVLTEVQERQA